MTGANEKIRFYAPVVLLIAGAIGIGVRLVLLHLNLVLAHSKQPNYGFTRNTLGPRGTIYCSIYGTQDTCVLAQTKTVWDYHLDAQAATRDPTNPKKPMSPQMRREKMQTLSDVLQIPLVKVMDGRIAHVYYKSETTLPGKMRADETGLSDDGTLSYFIYGGSEDNTAMENGLLFYVDWLRGQKTGFFVDQRDNRLLLERFAKGKRVLNMFCYTGGFSFYAMRGGAELVHSVDSSAKAIELTNRNVELNFPGDTRHQAFCEDAFRYLEQAGSQYNLIILDPPAFAKHRGALHNALKGYTRLNHKAFQKIQSGGILFTFSCSQVVTKDHFRNAVFTAAAQAGRQVRILHQLHQPADHPINIYHPEGEYLKGLVLYVE